MTMVFKRYPGGGNERLLALALADEARDDGTSVFPSVARLASKSAQSERSVQRLLHVMLASGWLQLVRKSTGRRGDCNEYRISPEWIAGADPIAPPAVPDRRTSAKRAAATGANLTPVNEAQPVDTLSPTGDTQGLSGDTQGLSGDRALSPNPVLPGITRYPLTPAGAGDSKNSPEAGNPPASRARWRWRESFEGYMQRGAELGLPWSAASLGSAWTDDAMARLQRAYRAQVDEAHERSERERGRSTPPAGRAARGPAPGRPNARGKP